jgi:hypothetical protein
VYEEVYKESLIRPCLPHGMRIDMYNEWVNYNDLESSEWIVHREGGIIEVWGRCVLQCARNLNAKSASCGHNFLLLYLHSHIE